MARTSSSSALSPRDAREQLRAYAEQGGACTPNDPPRIVNETSSRGIDEYLQLIGGGKGQRQARSGLRIPTAPYSAPGVTSTLGVNRYQFLLTSVKVGVGRRVRLRGARQMVTIGARMQGLSSSDIYVVELPVTTPNWSFQDGNVSWSLVLVKPQPVPLPFKTVYNLTGSNADNFLFRYADPCAAGALLYENYSMPVANSRTTGAPDYYTFLNGYVAPTFPTSDTISGDLNEFSDLRFPWNSARAWDSLDVVVDGPVTIAMFASVRQTNPNTRNTNPQTSNNVPAPNCLPEEQFINYVQAGSLGQAIYWRIAGALITEDVS